MPKVTHSSHLFELGSKEEAQNSALTGLSKFTLTVKTF